MKRMRRRPAGLMPPIQCDADEKAVAKAIASMAAFDAMPPEWRRFCAEHGRTARGESLANVLAEQGGDIGAAMWMLQRLLPVLPPPDIEVPVRKPWRTYDLKAERKARKPTRRRKAKT